MAKIPKARFPFLCLGKTESSDTYVMEEEINIIGNEYYDYGDFIREVKRLNIFDLRPLGLIPDSMIGLFFPDRLSELIEFCKEHPEFHILSSMQNSLMINCVTQGAHNYSLCNGNSNPKLICKGYLLDVWIPVAE